MKFFIGLILLSFGFTAYDYSAPKSEQLTVRRFDANLLNKTIFHLINEKRSKKGVDTLEYTEALNRVCKNYQEDYEFKNFRNSSSIERKIGRKVHEKTKKMGFEGGLILPVAAQSEALDYDGKKDFFLDRRNDESEFHLFYGKKPRKSEVDPVRTPIAAHTYYVFAQQILDEMDSENRKQLYKKHYKWGGIHTQWYYKSLNKRRMPKIKMIFLLGGYATAGMR